MKTTQQNGIRITLALLTGITLLTGCVMVPVGHHGAVAPVPIISVPVPIFVPVGHH